MQAIQGIVILWICCLSIPGFSAENSLADRPNVITPNPAATEGTNAEAAMSAPPDVNAPVANDGSTALHEAAQFNRLDEAQALLAKGAAVNTANNVGLTPLHMAALAGHAAMVTLLLDHNADVKAKDAFGLTPLHCAAQHGQVKSINILLAKGAEIESKTYTQGLTPLHWAAFWGHIEGIKCLLGAGADINACDNTGNTPLTWAEAYGQHDTARLLARKGGKGHTHEKLYGLDASWHVD